MKARRKVDLKKTLFLLPNLITLSSIFCGFDSIRISATATSDDDYYRASILLVYALIFDMLDGRVARLTKTQSAFGLQIDSLADVVSFGVAPALLVYKWSLFQQGTAGLVVSFLFVAAAAVRLARFNVLSMDTGGRPVKPSRYIVGLPVPGAAGVLVSLVVANHAASSGLSGPAYVYPMMALTVLLAFFQISTFRFRSFKDLKPNARTFGLVLFMAVSSVLVALRTTPAFVLVWLLSVYVVIGIVETAIGFPGRLKKRKTERRSLPPT